MKETIRLLAVILLLCILWGFGMYELDEHVIGPWQLKNWEPTTKTEFVSM